ncbi:hypothetical protein AUP68_16195 [Ilyonectria robusta]
MTTLKPTITLREATLEDVPTMVDVYFDAFHDNPLNQRCFLDSSQDARTYWTKWIEATFPSSGENAVAAHFFQTAREATQRVVAGRDFWFLSMIVTRREAQRRGIGAAMMRFGVELADKEGWMAYLNASKSGRPLYELFGFKVQEHTWFDDLGLDMFHMTRDPRGVNGN